MIILGVNIDHVATIRQARGTSYPSILDAASAVIKGGAGQITVHLREDRRHVVDQDVYDLKETISVPLNLEMAAEDEIVNIAIDVSPQTVTLVPEKRKELTTEGGLDCILNKDKLFKVIAKLKRTGIVVSLFLDPEVGQIEMAKEIGADAIELHTGTYCDAINPEARKSELGKLKEAAVLTKEMGLKVCAGHGLNYDNTALVVETIPEIVEYNIGHAIVAKAIFSGLAQATQEMKSLLK
jgi:pyridoxine 5-phosphate synthase